MSACLRSTDRLSSFAIVLRIASSSVRSSLGWVSGMLLDSAIYRGLCPKLTTKGTKNTKKIKVKGNPKYVQVRRCVRPEDIANGESLHRPLGEQARWKSVRRTLS